MQSLRGLRGELRWFFEQQAVPAAVSEDLILAAQEACNNACRYGAAGADCDLVVTIAGGAVTIEVADGVRGSTSRRSRRPGPLRCSTPAAAASFSSPS